MTKTKAVKMILDNIDGGLPRAIEIYNYITGYGSTEATPEQILRYIRQDAEIDEYLQTACGGWL